ncbi:hypothetical protein BDZ89DRAFT_1137484 [Hymenopellis radicata]|nr:hypothetical protein BDZ89DRAFT_1137484 [Hymenopellis radicata]
MAIQDLEKAVQTIAEFCNFSSREKFHLRTEALPEFKLYLNDEALWLHFLEQSSTMKVIQDGPENTQRGIVRADNYLAIVGGAAGNKIRSVHVGVYAVSNTKRDITVVYGPQTTVADVLKEYIRIYDKPLELNFRWMGGADILNPSSRWTVYGFRDGEMLHEVLPL